MQARAAGKGKEEAATEADAAKEAAPAAVPAAAEAPAAAAASPAQMPGGQPESNGHAQPSHGAMQPKKGRKRKAEQADQKDARQGEPSEAGERHSAPQRQKENGSSAGGHDKAPKWKKLATEVLQGRKNRRMKVAKLQAKVLSASGLGTDALGDHSAAMLRRWANSAKLVVQDGYVSLT